MDGYGPSTYGDRFADVYDDWYGDVSDADATVERVAALAAAAGSRPRARAGWGQRAAGGAAGRPGIETWTVDASLAMVGGCGPSRAATGSTPCVGDMAALALSTRARFGVRAVRVQHLVQPHDDRGPAALPGRRRRPDRPPGRASGGRVVRRTAPRRAQRRGRRGRAPAHRSRRGGADRRAGSIPAARPSPASTSRSPRPASGCVPGCCATCRPASSTRWRPRPGSARRAPRRVARQNRSRRRARPRLHVRVDAPRLAVRRRGAPRRAHHDSRPPPLMLLR